MLSVEVTVWVTVAVSSSASASCAAFTVTVFGVFQSVEENVRLAGSAVTSVLDGSLMATATLAMGWLSSTMVYVPELPSAMVSEASETETPAPSSSVMLTVACVVVPSETAGGNVMPKLSLTLSSSSSTSSWMASKVMVCDICPVLKVTLGGTPE